MKLIIFFTLLMSQFLHSFEPCKIKIENNDQWIMCQGCGDRWYGKMDRIVERRLRKKGFEVVSEDSNEYDYLINVTKKKSGSNKVLTTAIVTNLDNILLDKSEDVGSASDMFFTIADRNGTRRAVSGLDYCSNLRKKEKRAYAIESSSDSYMVEP